MNQKHKTVLLLGSYNGQDSLGDECLLKSVIDRYSRVGGVRVHFVLHAHRHTPLLRKLEREGALESNVGVQSLFWRLRAKLRHLHLPPRAHSAVAALSFPTYLGLGSLLGDEDCRRALRQIRQADAVHIFGGTNFSFQWFWLNAPHYMMTSALARLHGAPTYFGPQQYGPMTPLQRFAFKTWLRLGVADFRARNPECVRELEADADKLCADEVYSNRHLYPPRNGDNPGNYILINVRGGSLVDDSSLAVEELDRFADLLRGLHAKMGLPYRFFAVSGERFCDDDASFRALRTRVGDVIEMDSVGRVKDEFELIDQAREARACISMSFHGCLLSGFAGIPFVPVTLGSYYDHKYAGFDMYGDGRPIPRIALDRAPDGALIAAVHSFIEGYDPERAAQRREAQARKVDAYYADIAHHALGT